MQRLLEIPREEFLACYFDYEPGEHVVFFEPTQQGKTFFAYQLLGRAMAQHPELSTLSLMPKSRSPATRAWAQRLGMPLTERFPPPGRFPWQEKPPGHVLWPKHLKNVPVKQNREHLAAIFRAAMARQLQLGQSLTFADDAHVLVLLGLNDMFEEMLTTGAEGGAGLWLASQKTSGTLQGALTTFAYNQPAHIILGHEPIGENRKRFNDIGGIDAGLVANVVAGLRKHRIQTPHGAKNISEKLYIRKDGPYMCIVGI